MLRYVLFSAFLIITGCSTPQVIKPSKDTVQVTSPVQEQPTKEDPIKLIEPTPAPVALPLIEKKKTYHSTGQLAYITTYKNNIKVSKESFIYYQTGELSIQFNSINNKKNGLVKHYSKNGDIWRTQEYKHGKKDGLSISYYSPQSIAKKSRFKAGQPDGIHEAFLTNGKRSDKWIFEQGKLISHFKFQHFESGALQFQHTFRNKMKNGLSKEYVEDGKLISSVNYKNNFRHGKTLLFYNSGNIKEEKRYIDNQQHGSSSGYFKTGELQWQSYFLNGERHGLYKEYYQNGQLKKQIRYQQGKQNGPKRFFHENGYLKYELTMKNSKADGLLKEFDSEGNLKVTRHYNNGEITKENSSFLNGYLLWLSENNMGKLIN